MPSRIEEAAAKGAAKLKAGGAHARGLRGIFKTLMEEHGEASALLKRLSQSDDPAKRADLFAALRKELLTHEQGERDLVYAQLSEHEATRAMAADHEDEAREMEALLAQLNIEAWDSPGWQPMVERLEAVVQHHVEEEERRYFPKAQEVLGEDEAEALDQRYRARKGAHSS